MFNNDALNSRIKKLLKDLKKQEGITLYRVAKETSIPHSSLKYMLDNRFEWKLNHLYELINFIKRYKRNISIDTLLMDKPDSEKGNIDYGISQFYVTSPNTLNTFTVAPDPKINYRVYSKEISKKKKDSPAVLLSSEDDHAGKEIADDICRVLSKSSSVKDKKVSVHLKILNEGDASEDEIKFTYSKSEMGGRN